MNTVIEASQDTDAARERQVLRRQSAADRRAAIQVTAAWHLAAMANEGFKPQATVGGWVIHFGGQR